MELRGRISGITRKHEYATFKIQTKTDQVKCRLEDVPSVIYSLQNHDIIDCLAEVGDHQIYRITQPPLIIPSVSEEMFQHYCVIAPKRFNAFIYTKMYSEYRSHSKIFQELTDQALLYDQTGTLSTMAEFFGNDTGKFLQWWKRTHDLRKLNLLGVSNMEIDDLEEYDYIELYQQLMKDPIKVYQLDFKVIQQIIQRLNLNYSSLRLHSSSLARWLHWQSSESVGIPMEQFQQKLCQNKSFQQHGLKFLQLFEAEYHMWNDGHGLILTPFRKKIQESLAKKFARMLSYNQLPNQPLQLGLVNVSEEQAKAIHGAIQHHISIIVGAAGTGKSFIIKALVDYFDLIEQTYNILTFTGQATSRVKEIVSTNRAMTIDRFIYSHQKTPDVLILDETGMISNYLMYRLLTHLSGFPKLILIGDPNQLLSIRWGNLFPELINHSGIPVFRLTQIFRLQDRSDTLYQNVDNILKRQPLVTSENFMIQENFPLNAFSQLPFDDRMTVISPYVIDLPEINEIISASLNHGPSIQDRKRRMFRLGDRVQMTKNNHANEIYNGSEGKVVKITPKVVTVLFDDRVPLDFVINAGSGQGSLGLDDLRVSYAKSVHSSQGSEYEIVFIWFPEKSRSSNFLCNNLIYTAVTRAKRQCYCFGKVSVLDPAIQQSAAVRHDNLGALIKDLA